MSEDALLLDRWIRSRDAEAFRGLVDRYAGMVHATASRILGDPARAEDVAQDCFLRLSLAPGSRSNLPAWLHSVARNRALDLLRNERLRREKEAHWEPPVGGGAGPAGPAASASVWEGVEPLVDEAIDRLPGGLRAPIVLHFLCGQRLEDVGETLGLSKAGVSYRIEKGIESIRSFLRRRGVGAASALLAGWLTTRGAGAAPPGLTAALGKLALAGPGAATGLRASPTSALPAATGSLWILGGLMKLWTSLAALAVLGAVLFFVLRSRPDGVDPAPVAGRQPVVAVSPAPAAPGPAGGDAEKKTADAPAPEEPKKPLATVAGRVIDSEGNPIASADVLIAFEPPVPGDDFLGAARMAPGWLSVDRSWFARTGRDGSFRIEGIDIAGPATLSAFAEGREGATTGVKVEEGQEMAGQELKLAAGKTLRGILLRGDGEPVTDAILSIYYAWHPKDLAFGGSLGATDEDGRFEIGLSAKAEMCHLRANSASLGQDFFLDVPVTGEEVVLEWKEPAALKGRITWQEGEPATGVLVVLSAEVPEPKIAVFYSGIRPRMTVEAPTDADGRYEARGLQPGFQYDAEVIAAAGDRRQARNHPLTPRWTNHVTLEAGEEGTWDATIARPIAIAGHVRTEILGSPVYRAHIALKKDGKPLPDDFVQTAADGSFRLPISSGPGRYFAYAVPYILQTSGADPIAERFGKEIDLHPGDEVDVDLFVFEPISLPIHVVDADGKAVGSIRYEIEFTTADGRRFGHGDSDNLGAEGRKVFVLHFPVKVLALSVSSFPSGPMTEKKSFGETAAGTALDPVEFVLPRTCKVSGTILDAARKPVADANVTVEATLGPGNATSLSARTDASGRFHLDGMLRAAEVTLKVRGDGDTSWTSGKLDGAAGDIDLGEVVLAPKS